MSTTGSLFEMPKADEVAPKPVSAPVNPPAPPSQVSAAPASAPVPVAVAPVAVPVAAPVVAAPVRVPAPAPVVATVATPAPVRPVAPAVVAAVRTASVEDLSVTEIEARIAELQKQKSMKLKGGNIALVVAGLEKATPEQVQDHLDVLSGSKMIVERRGTFKFGSPKPKDSTPRETKEFSLKDGKVYFGKEEIQATKKDKKGLLRIVKEGKGLPPVVARQTSEIQDILLKLPVKA